MPPSTSLKADTSATTVAPSLTFPIIITSPVASSFNGLTLYVMVDVVEPPFPSDIVITTLSLPLKLVAGIYVTFPVGASKVTCPWKPAFGDNTEIMLRV